MKIEGKIGVCLRFALYVFLVVASAKKCLAFTSIIDTREGGAQQRLAYVFPTIYSFTDQGGYYGDIEFRGGLQSDFGSPTFTIELGTISALNGPIYLQSGFGITELWINLRYGLSVGRTSFQVDAGNPALIAFQWGTAGDTNSYTISLNDDVTVGSDVSLLLWSTTSGVAGNVDGNNHTLTLAAGSLFYPVSLTGKDIVLKNMRIVGAENMRSTYDIYPGTNILQNVVMDSFIADDAHALKMPLISLVYRGLENVLGDGGYYQFYKIRYQPWHPYFNTNRAYGNATNAIVVRTCKCAGWEFCYV